MVRAGFESSRACIQDIILSHERVDRGEREGKSVRLVDGLVGLDRGPRRRFVRRGDRRKRARLCPEIHGSSYLETRREYVSAGVIFSLLRLQNTHIRLSSRRVNLEGLRSRAAEGIASPPLSCRARPCTREESADAQNNAARDRTPLRAGVPERAVLESYRVLEPALRGTNAQQLTTD